MKFFLYSVKRSDKSVNGFIKACSKQEAIDRLQGNEFTDIHIHGYGQERPELENLSAAELEQQADFELKIMDNPSTTVFLLEVFRQYYMTILLLIFIVWLSVKDGNYWAISTGLLIIVIGGVAAIWVSRHARRYTQLLRSMALGSWPEAKSLIIKLRPYMESQDIQFDLDVREACIFATEGSLGKALQLMEKWRHKAPPYFESRLASIYYYYGDYHTFLKQIQKAYDVSKETITAVDLAMAEARFGSIEIAQRLIEGLTNKELKQLSPGSMIFLKMTRGLIALRLNRYDQAKELLMDSTSDFASCKNQPAYWSVWAISAGYLALSLAASGQIKVAESVLEPVLRVFRITADKVLIDEVQKKIGIRC